MNKNIEYKNDDFTINVVEEPQIYLFDEVSEHDNKIDINNSINKEKIPTLRKIKRGVLPTHLPTQKHHI